MSKKPVDEIEDDGDEGFDGERRVVQLVDDTGATLPAEVVLELTVDGNLYALLTPSQPVVAILCEDMNDEEAPLEELEPSEMSPELMHHINSALRDFGAGLQVRADEFVLDGDLSAEIYEDSELIELEGEEETLEYLLIVDVEDGMKRYTVALPTEPLIYPAEILADEKARLLSDEELERYQDVFEAALNGDDGDED